MTFRQKCPRINENLICCLRSKIRKLKVFSSPQLPTDESWLTSSSFQFEFIFELWLSSSQCYVICISWILLLILDELFQEPLNRMSLSEWPLWLKERISGRVGTMTTICILHPWPIKRQRSSSRPISEHFRNSPKAIPGWLKIDFIKCKRIISRQQLEKYSLIKTYFERSVTLDIWPLLPFDSLVCGHHNF